MSFVIDKQGDYLPVLGEAASGGGGGGTTDHAELSHLDYASSGHTGFMSSANYIPGGTVINIKADGSGDYATIKDAVDSLYHKWSDGEVQIKLDEGTFTLDSQITFNGSNCNIPVIKLQGEGKTKTTIQNSVNNSIDVTNNIYVMFQNFAYVSTYGTKQARAMVAQRATLYVSNVSFDNFAGYCPGAYGGGTALIGSGIEISNCSQGINLEAGIARINWGATIAFTNIANQWFWVGGGAILQGGMASCTYTNASTHFSQTVGTATADGWITGFSV